jgi:hypothetical protein
VSRTPLLPLLLAVGREFWRAVLRVLGLVLRLDPLRDAAAVLLREAAVLVPEDFLAPEVFRAVVLAALLDRFAPVLGVLAAIVSGLLPRKRHCLLATRLPPRRRNVRELARHD